MRQKKTLSVLSGAIALALSAASVQANGFNIGDTDVTFGGYVKLDAMYTDSSDGQIATGIGRDFYIPSLTPVGGADEGGTFDFHARQSRFFFKTNTKLDNGKTLGGHIELDFMATSGGDERITNSYSPRLRQAFITYDGWLFGQTWSTFMDLNALPDTLDFIGNTDAMPFVRQAQIRYTSGNFQIAIENPETTVTPFGGGARITTDDNATPDLVFKYAQKTQWGSWSVSALVRQLAYETATIDTTTSAFGLSATAKIMLANNNDIRMTATTGSGVGRYIGLNTANGGVLDANNELEAIDSSAFAIAYRHNWNSQWRSNLVYSVLSVDNDLGLTGAGVTKTTSSWTTNLIYQAAKKLMFGVEYKLANREAESGLDGDMHRLQFSAKYDF
ncbi:DcaP family trimeric outer membrane transporter [Arsukibacterium sp.]|uniref:DcaP family trimeric outer membrane transporter n=1 Tax=Arsukibacterium sp. TaxID=1977258 RepID=UPI00299D7AA0|nr:DcaP family trimeric outer membrane transporter [Arsukibacterium sp.]MDX1677194.1 DcaP family trimeric outer membrane transporter [Arsukibacterium sp.]